MPCTALHCSYLAYILQQATAVACRRDPTPPEVRLAREKERELKELERATRTVFAYNLNIKADERDIFEFFSLAGEVTDIRLITDRNTKRSKGLAYIEFASQQQVFSALALTGQMMMGQAVMVKPAEAEKNLAWEAQQAAKQTQADVSAVLGTAVDMGPGAVGPIKLQVTGFKPGFGEAELRQIFEPFGALESVNVVRDGAGQPVGIAYVVFRNFHEGQTAMAHWNGNMLLDSLLVVTPAPLTSAEGGPTTTVGELDEDEDNFKLSNQARAALMSRLANSAGLPGLPPTAMAPAPMMPAVPVAPQPQVDPLLMLDQGLLGPPSPIPTPCLLLKNMFNPAEQTDPNWLAEITDDVRDECSKFGPILHIWVDPNSRVGTKQHVNDSLQRSLAQLPSGTTSVDCANGRLCASQTVAHVHVCLVHQQHLLN